MEKKEKQEDFVNPIDIDKVAENPHLLPYAHSVGGAVIKPIDKGRTKGLAVQAMHQQTQKQLEQIHKQMQLLAQQAKELQRRVEVSELIYEADLNFKPLIGKEYTVYQRSDETTVLSVIGPDEWGKRGCPFNRFVAHVQLLADHTWEVLEWGEEH